MFPRAKLLTTTKRTTRIPIVSLKRIQLSKGIFSRIARELGVTVGAVTRVANGEKRSKRIAAAIEAELHRIDNIVKKTKRQSAA